MVTTIAPPHWKPSNLSFLFAHHLQLEKIFNRPKLQKSLHQIFMWSFPLSTFFHPSKKHHPFLFWRENSTHHFGAERFPGLALCGLPRTSQLRHGVDEIQSAKGARVFSKTPRRFFAAGRFLCFATFFFFYFRSFFLSHPRFPSFGVFCFGTW